MSEFRTLQGYDRQTLNKGLTRSMEDYLEMICRQAKKQGYIRINELAVQLHVRPSSASKMADVLKKEGYIAYEKYGVIKPTKKGWDVGRYLLYRHDVLHAFLCRINQSQDELEQVEKIEHFLNDRTIRNLDEWLKAQKSDDPATEKDKRL